MSRNQPRFQYGPNASASDMTNRSRNAPSIEADTQFQSGLDDPQYAETSERFVGQWEKLISTTNWDKGRIVVKWRESLSSSGASSTVFSDEAWTRRVGGVTPQHVGRLRRVYERFGSRYSTFPALFWTHFLAALDWDDAEMWLEGAVQSQWSVSQMRSQRWEAFGADPSKLPRDEDIIVGEVDEDYSPLSESVTATDREPFDRMSASGPLPEGPDFGDADNPSGRSVFSDEDAIPFEEDPSSDNPLVSPFASLPRLPADVADALELFKLSIVRHRSNDWSEISQEDLLKTIEALRQFVLARAQ